MSLFPDLPAKKFSIIYADPPWDYKGQTQHTGKGGKSSGGSKNHYATVKLWDLMKLDVPSICEDDCLLFMWSSSPHLNQAIDLMTVWQFDWSTVGFVWEKQKTNPGFYTVSQCELCLIGKRGKIPQPRGSRKERQFLSEMRGEHSAKPDEVRSRIGRMFPTQSKIELFARCPSTGWHAWGKEI